MSAPRVSVVVTTYNRSALLVEALESVFAQTCQDFEVIVVNDGSTDDTAAVLERYGARVRCVHQANSGLSAARNAALRVARGEFFALLDDDDLWEPHKLELSLALADRFPRAAFVFSNFSILRDGQRITRDGLHTWRPATQWHEIFVHRHRFSAADLGMDTQRVQLQAREFDVYEGDVYDTSLEAPWVLPSASLVRRSAVPDGFEFYPQHLSCGDWEYFARLSKRGGALFVDLDIAINRSHQAAGRLTGMPRHTQIARRVTLTERVWLADDEYMGRYAARVRATLHDRLVKLARAQLLAGDARAARTALERAAALGNRRSAAEWMTYCAAHIPGSGPSLRALRRLMSARG